MSKRKSEANKIVLESMIVAGLCKQKFIEKKEDGSFVIDMTSRVRDVYGDKSEDTIQDIFEILRRVAKGLEVNKQKVVVKRLEGV